jgi:hypothetical protein
MEYIIVAVVCFAVGIYVGMNKDKLLARLRKGQ